MSEASVNRRDFARRLAAATAATAAVVGSGPASADDGDDPKPSKKSKTEQSDKPKPEPPPPPAALMLEVIRLSYPHEQLDDEDVLAGIYRELRIDRVRSRRLARFPLENSDEPGFIFAARRGDEASTG